jgi:hypothetical protein
MFPKEQSDVSVDSYKTQFTSMSDMTFIKCIHLYHVFNYLLFQLVLKYTAVQLNTKAPKSLEFYSIHVSAPILSYLKLIQTKLSIKSIIDAWMHFSIKLQ